MKPKPWPLLENIVTLRWLKVEALGTHVWTQLVQTLDQTEQARAERFHFEHDRQSYIAAHALTRAMLSQRAEQPPNAWRFVNGPHGKPEVASAEDPVQFNLSHTRGLVAVAVTSRHSVGVDVEEIDPNRLGLDVADRFFS